MFHKTDRDMVAARIAVVGEGFMCEPEIRSVSMKRNPALKGMMLFLDEYPQEDWTHLVVTGHTRALVQPGMRNKGAALFARRAEPYDMDCYLDFRRDLAMRLMRELLGVDNYLQIPFDRIVEIADEMWPEFGRHSTVRLVCRSRSIGNGSFVYDYAHLKDEEPEEETSEEIKETE